MSNRTLSTSVDETVARFVEDLVKIDGRSSSQILAAALQLYLRLPHEAQRAFRVVDALGTDDERAGAIREVTRALLNAQYDVAERQVVTRLDSGKPLEDEDDLMDEAVRMVAAARR